MFIRIRGVLHYLWRAVDQHGVVLDILVRDRRNGAAAKRLFNHLLHGLHDDEVRVLAGPFDTEALALEWIDDGTLSSR